MMYGFKQPPLELKATNCSMFENIIISNNNISSTTSNNSLHHLQYLSELNVTTEKTEFQLPGFDRDLEFEDIYRMSYNIYPILGMVLTMVLSIDGSLTTMSETDEVVHEDLVHPIALKMFSRKAKKSSSEEYILRDEKSPKICDHHETDIKLKNMITV